MCWQSSKLLTSAAMAGPARLGAFDNLQALPLHLYGKGSPKVPIIIILAVNFVHKHPRSNKRKLSKCIVSSPDPAPKEGMAMIFF